MNQVKVTERVQKQLFELQDLQYRDFQAKLLPTIEKETVIVCECLCFANLQKDMEKQKKQKNS